MRQEEPIECKEDTQVEVGGAVGVVKGSLAVMQ